MLLSQGFLLFICHYTRFADYRKVFRRNSFSMGSIGAFLLKPDMTCIFSLQNLRSYEIKQKAKIVSRSKSRISFKHSGMKRGCSFSSIFAPYYKQLLKLIVITKNSQVTLSIITRSNFLPASNILCKIEYGNFLFYVHDFLQGNLGTSASCSVAFICFHDHGSFLYTPGVHIHIHYVSV